MATTGSPTGQVYMGADRITIVVPTYQAPGYLTPLFDSIVSSGLAPQVFEVIFVNDGSTDSTDRVLDLIQSRSQATGVSVRVIRFEQNRGRFIARYEGAKAASTAKILFMDSRMVFPDGFGATFGVARQSYGSMIGHVDIDTSKDIYALYWERSHARLFSRHFEDTKKPLLLTFANYDQYLKGTGSFYCSRTVFLAACDLFQDRPLLSDDTFLMKEMVKSEPILIHPELRLGWSPRNNARDFLLALWNRGPGFAEYHLFERRGALFWVVTVGAIALIAWLALLLINPNFSLIIAAVALALAALSCAAFARTPAEFFKLAPLHVGVLFAYGLGAIRGVFVVLKKRRG